MKHYQKSVALLATGDELVRGEVLDTNSQYFAKTLTALGIDVLSQQLVCDTQSAIERALIAQLAEHDCVIVCGELGSTSDDLTRFAIAAVLQRPLIFHDQAWHHICQRLQNFTGLAELWQQTAFSGKTKLTCSITYNCKTKTIAMEIPYRGSEVIDYAVHFIAYCLVQFLNKEMNTSQAQSTAAINDEVIEKIIQARDKN